MPTIEVSVREAVQFYDRKFRECLFPGRIIDKVDLSSSLKWASNGKMDSYSTIHYAKGVINVKKDLQSIRQAIDAAEVYLEKAVDLVEGVRQIYDEEFSQGGDV